MSTPARKLYGKTISTANAKVTLVAATKTILQFATGTTRAVITLHSAVALGVQIVARDAGAALIWDNDLTTHWLRNQYDELILDSLFLELFDVVLYSAGAPKVSYIGFFGS